MGIAAGVSDRWPLGDRQPSSRASDSTISNWPPELVAHCRRRRSETRRGAVEHGGFSERLQAYRRSLLRDFSADLEFGSRLARQVFIGRFLFGSVPQRMVQFTRRSPRFSSLMQDLFAGTQSYLGLKKRLLQNLNGSLFEIAMSFGLSRLLPGNSGT